MQLSGDDKTSAVIAIQPVRDLVREALNALASGPDDARSRLADAAERLDTGPWTVLVAGLRSVGKSTFVCALWGDPSLLPIAVRDCTQTNTLIRVPAAEESDRTLRLGFLSRDRALEFATHGLAYHRLADMLRETQGPMGPRLDRGTAAERIEKAVAAVRTLFADRRDIQVLYEPLTEHLDQLEEFLAFLDSADFRPGEVVPAPWDERREFLMGRRRSDGRTLDVGKLLALRQVVVIRDSSVWSGAAPHVIDTPWIPRFHNARRAVLIADQADEADVLLIISLPEVFEPEDWLREILRGRPELARNTLIVFNQIDTVDPTALFGQRGFADGFRRSREAIAEIGIPGENMLMSCAHLPWLRSGEQDENSLGRMGKLEKALAHIRQLCANRPESAFTAELLPACEPDGGLGALRDRLTALGVEAAEQSRVREAIAAIREVDERELPTARQESWRALQRRATDLRT